MTGSRRKASIFVLIAGMLAMTVGPVYAVETHEVCDAMGHACAKVEALPACCCGDRSDANPSQVPSDRASLASPAQAVPAVAVVIDLPAMLAPLPHAGLAPLAHPPDLQILFSDLRL